MADRSLPNTPDTTKPTDTDETLEQMENMLYVMKELAEFNRNVLKAVTYDRDATGNMYDADVFTIDEDYNEIIDLIDDIEADVTGS